jgi:nucleoside-triphosphatase
MTHIFLTGEIQVGKSTVIKKTAALLKLPYGGFLTYFGPDRANNNRCLYINDAAAPPTYDKQQVIACFREGVSPEVYPERFNTLGVKYLSEARKNAQLMIMDECGSLEYSAQAFQDEVLDTLEGDIPVLGVVKLSAAGWVDRIRRHPRVQIITVDESNREALPALLKRLFVAV